MTPPQSLSSTAALASSVPSIFVSGFATTGAQVASSSGLVHGLLTVPTATTNTRTPTNPTAIPSFTDNANLIPAGSREYSFDFPAYDNDEVHLIFNYKDTIQVQWTDSQPYNSAILQINCWKRTDPPNSYPLWAAHVYDFTQNITVTVDVDSSTLSPSDQNQTTIAIPLGLYRPYNPCQFALIDSADASLTRGPVVSPDFVILEDEVAQPQVWNVTRTPPSAGTSVWNGSNSSGPNWWSEFGGGNGVKASSAAWSGKGWGNAVCIGLFVTAILRAL